MMGRIVHSMRGHVFRGSSQTVCFGSLLALAWALSCAVASGQQQSARQTEFDQRMVYSTDAVMTHHFLSAHGRRAVVMGYSQTGLEIWAYPFQILSDYQPSFLPAGSAQAVDGRMLLRRVDYLPQSVTRTYIGPDFLVREKIFVPLDQPAAVISYEVEGIRAVEIQLHFTPVLNLMWPGGLGGQYTRWKQVLPGEEGISGFVIAGQGNELVGVIGSKETTSHDDTVNSAMLTEHGYSFSMKPVDRPGGGRTATVYVALTEASPGETKPVAVQDPTALLGKLSQEAPRLEADFAAHYAELEATSLSIETPDEEVNRALAWTKVALDQAWVCNPRLGCGIVAGFGPSRDALRPQYAWYFGGDGLITTNALVSAGEYGRAREELRFIQHYQNQTNGMIWHELSQSAGYMDWLKLPFMYVHVDLTFDYLTVMGRYVTTSGDTGFAQESWRSIQAAYAYCKSSIGADHLPHIPPDKEASDEQHRPADDLNLSASWMAAAAGYGDLARLTGHTADAAAAGRDVELTRQAINADYWNTPGNFWYDGHTPTGQPIYREAIGPTQLIAQGLFTAERRKALLDRLTSADFQADWGTREVGASAKDYNPYSYGAGSVSPISTLGAATSFWQSHRPESALAVWRGVLGWSSLDAMGHIHEVLAGNFYHEQTESVAEQTWSSAAMIDSTVRGLLGLEIDAIRNRVEFAPHVPAEWPEVSIKNVGVSKTKLDLVLRQSVTSIDLEIDNSGGQMTMLFRPGLALGAKLVRAEYAGQQISATAETSGGDEQARLTLTVPHGASRCHLTLQGGVAIILPARQLRVGDASQAPKIVDVSLTGKMLTIEADIRDGQEGVFQLRTRWKPVPGGGQVIRDLGSDVYLVRTSFADAEQRSTDSASGFTRRHIVVAFEGLRCAADGC